MMQITRSPDNLALYEAKAQVLKALAHPSRLMILDALADGEKCVCELQQIVGSDMSTISRHLSVMKSAGLVADRKVGTMVFYRLTTSCLQQLFACVESILRHEAEARTKLLRV